MKWKKEAKCYMWASYYSEDGKWKSWDEDKKTVSRNTEVYRHVWYLKNLETGEVVETVFKTLKAAKEYAER